MTGITGGWDTAARHQRWSKVTKSATFFRFDMAWRFSSSGTFEEHWTPPSSPQPGRNPTESRAGKAGRCMYRKLRHRKGREKKPTSKNGRWTLQENHIFFLSHWGTWINMHWPGTAAGNLPFTGDYVRLYDMEDLIFQTFCREFWGPRFGGTGLTKDGGYDKQCGSPITDPKNSPRVLGLGGFFDSTQGSSLLEGFWRARSVGATTLRTGEATIPQDMGEVASDDDWLVVSDMKFGPWSHCPIIFRGWNVETNNQMILRTLTSTTPLLRSNPHRPVAYLCPYQNLPASWLATRRTLKRWNRISQRFLSCRPTYIHHWVIFWLQLFLW